MNKYLAWNLLFGIASDVASALLLLDDEVDDEDDVAGGVLYVGGGGVVKGFRRDLRDDVDDDVWLSLFECGVDDDDDEDDEGVCEEDWDEERVDSFCCCCDGCCEDVVGVYKRKRHQIYNSINSGKGNKSIR